MQLTRIPGTAGLGASRLLIEAVRVRSDRRASVIDGATMRWARRDATSALAAELMQLTSDAARTDAHRFSERLGSVGSDVSFEFRVG